MQIAIIGTGYVGLVSGACFAELGISVTCVDKEAEKIASLQEGQIPIFEPGLRELVARHFEAGRLQFTTHLAEAMQGAEAVFIAVGTPPDGEEGGADLSFVYAAAAEIAEHITDEMLVVTKSTVPVGTGDEIRRIISKARPDVTFHVASNPEFLREGCAVKDFLQPDRVLVGAESDDAKQVMERLYQPLSDRNIPVIFTDIRTAELTKYAANTFLATKIGFINEMADMCEKLGANIEDVATVMGLDHRIGKDYLKPGPGFGGSCFPKDILALRKMNRDAEAFIHIVDAVIESNDKRKLTMAKKIIHACGGGVGGKTLAILGLAFKANTDDMRHSPALAILPELLKAGATLRLYDPEAMTQAKQAIAGGEIYWSRDSYDALDGADAAVILTEWDEFRQLDLARLKQSLARPTIIDLRNLFSPEQMKQAGFDYYSVGR